MNKYLAVAQPQTPLIATPTAFSVDSMLPSLALLLAVATGLISVITGLTKGHEEKINRLMLKIDELDVRLDSVNVSIVALSDKYVTKQELMSVEKRIETALGDNRSLLLRMNDKLDRFTEGTIFH